MPGWKRPIVEEVVKTSVESLGELPRHCYELIVKSFQERGMSPTHEELAEAAMVGQGSIQTALRKLASAGLIRRGYGVFRGIRLISPEGVVCPCCGGSGILPDVSRNFGFPAGRTRKRTPVSTPIPCFVAPGSSMYGRVLNDEEIAILTRLFECHPDEGQSMIARRFQEKTGRLLAGRTVVNYRKKMSLSWAIAAPVRHPDNRRGQVLSDMEINIIGNLIRDNPGESDLKIAARFRMVTGRKTVKDTVKKYRAILGFPPRKKT